MNRKVESTSNSAKPDAFPVESLRAAFPALNLSPPFIFFDNAAGAQIPQVVFDAVKDRKSVV